MMNIREKLREHNGAYFFNLKNPEDAEYVLQSLGGRELLKKSYPAVYQAFQRTVQNDASESRPAEESKISVDTTNMTYEKSGSGTKFQALVSGFLCDPALEIKDLGIVQPRPWQSAFITSTIADSDDPTEPPYASCTLHCKKTNNFASQISTKSEIDEVTVAKTNLSVITEVVGADPDGNVMAAAFSNEYNNHANNGVRVIDSIVLEDPRYKNEKVNNPILMLYGRGAEQSPDYKFADYQGGEYKENNGGQEGDKDLKTLMPIKGRIVFKTGYEFKRLTVPTAGVKMYRPTISLSGAQVVKYYQDCWGTDEKTDYDMKLYNAIKDSFQKDKKQKNICNFDLKIDEKVDWKANLKDAGQYIKDNNRALDYLVNAAFRLDVSDGLVTGTVDLTVLYTDNKEVELYITTDGTSTVYIPAVRVYWGCMAKDSRLRTETGEREIKDIRPGDKVLSASGAYVTVADVITGNEGMIYRIRTDAGDIRLTGGHPLKLSDGDIRKAASLSPGDQLEAYGGTAFVTEVVQETYEDVVYNLVIHGQQDGCYLYVNDFVAGDMTAQNQTLTPADIEYSQEELRLQKEMDRLYKEFLKEDRGRR